MGDIHSILVSRLLLWTKKIENDQLSFYFTFRVTPHDRARNEIAHYFVKNKQFTHLFFIDSDTLPPEDALEKLISHDLPFVTGMTPIVRKNGAKGKYETFDNCFLDPVRNEDGTVKETPIAPRNSGIQKIYRCGAACMLIKREVFETMDVPYFAFDYSEDHLTHIRSEDIYFCDKARDTGITLYADTSVVCQHQKEIVL